MLLLWGSGTENPTDQLSAPLNAVKQMPQIRALIGIHPSKPFHGKFIQAMPKSGEGPVLTVSTSWNLSKYAVDNDALESFLIEKYEKGPNFEEFLNELKGSGWIIAECKELDGIVRAELDDAEFDELKLQERELDVKVLGTLITRGNDGVVTVDKVLLRTESGEVVIKFPLPLKETIKNAADVISDVVISEVISEIEKITRVDVNTLKERQGEVLSYAIKRVIADTIDCLKKTEYTLEYDGCNLIKLSKSGILINSYDDEITLPNPHEAYRSAFRNALREMVKRRIEEIEEKLTGC
ncbi:hypothetical protein [Methanopyrus sp.]